MKPTIVASKCLGFAHCRYNGITIYNDFIEYLRDRVVFITICPETEIGLNVPREPLQIVSKQGSLCLVQPATGLDLTKTMMHLARTFLDSIPEIDGFILKSRSPSCAVRDAKIFSIGGYRTRVYEGAGFFGSMVWKRFGHLPIEDEKRLENQGQREDFLRRLYAQTHVRLKVRRI